MGWRQIFATEWPDRGINLARSDSKDEALNKSGNDLMRINLLIGACLALTMPFAMPLAAQAQGIPGGAVHGFYEGNRIAGPLGAVVGTAVGGVVGGVEGVLGVGPSYVEYREEPVVRPYRHHHRYRHHRHYRHHH